MSPRRWVPTRRWARPVARVLSWWAAATIVLATFVELLARRTALGLAWQIVAFIVAVVLAAGLDWSVTVLTDRTDLVAVRRRIGGYTVVHLTLTARDVDPDDREAAEKSWRSWAAVCLTAPMILQDYTNTGFRRHYSSPDSPYRQIHMSSYVRDVDVPDLRADLKNLHGRHPLCGIQLEVLTEVETL